VTNFIKKKNIIYLITYLKPNITGCSEVLLNVLISELYNTVILFYFCTGLLSQYFISVLLQKATYV